MTVRPDLILIVCDTARADAFRPWGGRAATPTIERLCREGTWYENAIAPAPWTLPSHASLFTGRLPTEHGITGECFRWSHERPTSQERAIRSYPGDWLPDGMGRRGYRTYAASCNVWVSPWGGFDRGFDEFVHLYDGNRLPKGRLGKTSRRAIRMYGKVDKGGRQAVRYMRRWLVEDDRRPLFGFINLMEVHAPYDPPRPYYPYPFWKRARTRFLSGGSKRARRLVDAIEFGKPPADYVRAIKALYYAAAEYEDRLIRGVVDAVEDRGRPTVIAVVSDHGESLGERGHFNHNSSLGQPLLHVPMVVWGHRVEVGPGVVEDPVSVIGLFRWLQAVADGDPAPISSDGPVISEYESLAQHGRISPTVLETKASVPTLVHHPGVAIRMGRLKYVGIDNGNDALFDIESDPAEEHNVLEWRPDAGEQFRQLRDVWLRRRGSQPVYESGDAIAEGEIAEHLRSLGYIE